MNAGQEIQGPLSDKAVEAEWEARWAAAVRGFHEELRRRESKNLRNSDSDVTERERGNSF